LREADDGRQRTEDRKQKISNIEQGISNVEVTDCFGQINLASQ